MWHGPRLRWTAATDGLRLIWYDRRGAGLSEYDTSAYTLDDLAQDALGVLDHLGVGQAAVLATSAGGPIGLRLALDAPERVSSLVLLNTGAALMSLAPSGVVLDDPFVLSRLATVRRRLETLLLAAVQGAEAAVRATEDEWRTPPMPSIAPESEPLLDAQRRNRSSALERLPMDELVRLASGTLSNMRVLQEIDLTAEVGAIGCPTLVVHGDADTTVPHAYGKALARSMPSAEFVTIPGADHGLIVQPEAQRIVSEWLRGSYSSSSTLDQS